MSKGIYLFLALLITTPAGACPNLTGRYSCVLHNSESIIDLNQAQNAQGLVTYRWGVEEENIIKVFLADGNWHSADADIAASLRNAKYRATCETSRLIVEIQGEQNGNAIDSFQFLSLDSNLNLKNKTQISFGKFKMPADELVCTRLP